MQEERSWVQKMAIIISALLDAFVNLCTLYAIIVFTVYCIITIMFGNPIYFYKIFISGLLLIFMKYIINT